jgi:hemoglobin-like flavoprotein
MTKEQIQLVKQSWEHIAPVQLRIGELFYQRLFKEAPELRYMFKPDTTTQEGKLFDMLSHIVKNLDRLEILSDQVTELAKRHNQYGVKPQQYAIVRRCLIGVLAELLGEHWNEELKYAWVLAYHTLSSIMIDIQLDTGGPYLKSA